MVDSWLTKTSVGPIYEQGMEHERRPRAALVWTDAAELRRELQAPMDFVVPEACMEMTTDICLCKPPRACRICGGHAAMSAA